MVRSIWYATAFVAIVFALAMLSLAVPKQLQVFSQPGIAHAATVSSPSHHYVFLVQQMNVSPDSAVLSVDGSNYSYSSFPLALSFANGTGHSFSFRYTLGSGSNTYVYIGTNGCSVNGRTGTFVANEDCSLTAFYIKADKLGCIGSFCAYLPTGG
ncbi:MAG: hypothetical protein KGI00_02885 [Candidatus Micrarchaeota archaeon]|nr:hypothetical protein [Candidatus Micrarchaeota archaeon]